MKNIEERLKALEDDRKIKELVASFADACALGDAERFAALWKKDGVWILAEPLNIESSGRDDNKKLFTKLAVEKRFFRQMLHSGTINIKRETATARWILSESAAGKDGSNYKSIVMYNDQLVYEAGKWLFQERSCRFLDFSHDQKPNR